MAADFETLGVVATVEPLGGGQTRSVRLYSFRAVPSGVAATLVIAAVDMVPSHLRMIVPVVAAALNKANAVPGVDGISVYQDVDASGQFVTKMDVDVVSTSGNSSDTIHPPYGSIFDDRFEQAVARSRASMDAVEAL